MPVIKPMTSEQAMGTCDGSTVNLAGMNISQPYTLTENATPFTNPIIPSYQ